MTHALGYNFEKNSFLVDQESLGITTVPNSPKDRTDDMLKSFFEMAPNLKRKIDFLSMEQIENLRDLSQQLAKFIEGKRPPTSSEKLLGNDTPSRLRAISQQCTMLAEEKEGSLRNTVRSALESPDVSGFLQASKANSITCCFMQIALRHFAQEPFLSAQKYLRKNLVEALLKAERQEYSQRLNTLIEVDPELYFLQPLLEHNHSTFVAHTIIGTLEAEKSKHDLNHGKAGFCLSLFAYCHTLLVVNLETMPPLQALRHAATLYFMKDTLTLTDDKKRSLEFALDYLRYAVKLIKNELHKEFVHTLIDKLIQIDNEANWLLQLIETTCDAATLESIVRLLIVHAANAQRSFTTKVMQRVAQMRSVPEKEHKMSLLELFRHAYFIEAELTDSSCLTSVRYKKNATRSRSLIHSAQTGDTILLCKRHVPCTRKDHLQKRYSMAIVLSSSAKRAAQLAIQAVNRDTHAESFNKEALIYQSLNGIPGIWPLINVCRYPHRSSVRISIITKKEEGTLQDLFTGTFSFEQKELVKIFRQLTQGIEYLHETRKLAHGSIDPQAIYYGTMSDGEWIAGLHSFESCMQATELLCKKDVHDLGAVFYRWLTSKSHYAETIKDREQQLLHLNQKSELTRNEKLLWILLNMLLVDVDTRFDINRVRQELESLDLS